MMGGWGMTMMLLMVLFWVIVIVAVVVLVRHLTREPDRSVSDDRGSAAALHVLERRFAQGEIDSDEYHQRRSTLEGGG
jgi:putative membrane protein